MNPFQIHFSLQALEKIEPFGANSGSHLSWFGLTDGVLWIEIGDRSIYTYSKQAQQYFDSKTAYNEYYISRFLEDFFAIFPMVAQSIPYELYKEIENFKRDTEDWLTHHESLPEQEFCRFYDEEYLPLTQWYWNRGFDSGHLVAGPWIGCFRHQDKVKILWEGDWIEQAGISVWEYPNATVELNYRDFVEGVELFFCQFFEAMTQQVTQAIEKEWLEISLDKAYLQQEHLQRKEMFGKQVAQLKTEQPTQDWCKIVEFYQKLQREKESS